MIGLEIEKFICVGLLTDAIANDITRQKKKPWKKYLKSQNNPAGKWLGWRGKLSDIGRATDRHGF
jgi:hypothetical protein